MKFNKDLNNQSSDPDDSSPHLSSIKDSLIDMTSEGKYSVLEMKDSKSEFNNIMHIQRSSTQKGHKMKQNLPLTIGKYFNENFPNVIEEENNDSESSKDNDKSFEKLQKCKSLSVNNT